MDFGIFMQSLTGPSTTSSLSGLSNTANPISPWPSSRGSVTGEDNESFKQTVRQFLGQNGSDWQANGDSTASEQKPCDDPQTMFLIAMVGNSLLNDPSVEVAAGLDSSVVTAHPDVQDLLRERLVELETSLAAAMGTSEATAELSDQTLTMVKTAMNRIFGEERSSEPTGGIVAPQAIADDGAASGGPSDGKLSLPPQEKAVAPDLFKEATDSMAATRPTADQKAAPPVPEGGRTIDFYTGSTDTTTTSATNNGLNDPKIAARPQENTADVAFTKESTNIRNATDNRVETMVAAVKQEKTEAAGFTVKTADSSIKNDPLLAGRVVPSKDMAAQQHGSLEGSVRWGHGISSTFQSEGTGQDQIKNEPVANIRPQPVVPATGDDGEVSVVDKRLSASESDRQQTPVEPVRLSSAENAKTDTITNESPKMTATPDSIIEGKPSTISTVSSPPTASAAGTPTQESGDAAFHKVVMDQIVEKAVFRSSTDRSEMRIQLKPETLGDVRMSIVAEKNQLAVRMIADNPAVKEIIESQLHQLRAELDKQGVTVEKIEVLVSTDGDTPHNREQFSQMSKNTSFGNGKKESDRQGQDSQPQSQNGDEKDPDPSGDGINYFA